MRKPRTARDHRIVRHRRVRSRISGTQNKPRLAVFRSLSHIYSQIIDDDVRCTLTSASSLEPEVQGKKTGKSKTQIAKEVGELLARRCKENGVSKVVFDRGGFKYHGRLRALADAAREGGLDF
jgi:large subunit ribosomal protein L18